MLKSNGSVKLVKVPDKMCLTANGVREIDDFLNFEFNKNDVMRRNSMSRYSFWCYNKRNVFIVFEGVWDLWKREKK